MSKKAFIFPGQGSQYVGMAKDLYDNSVEVREMVKTADEAIGISLSQIMFNGPEEALKQTDVTQPSIFLHSVVAYSLIRLIEPDAVAGHSLGEYSALVASKSLQFYDAIKLVRVRGEAMLKAGIEQPGTMAAIVGLDSSKLDEICVVASEKGVVQAANYNSPGQIVISGSVDGVKNAMELCKASGAKLVKELVVSGAFHSPLMSSAKDRLVNQINETPFFDSKIPVFANVTAKPVNNASDIKDLLVKQLTKPVRWEETIKNMVSEGIEEFYEIGPGKVLQGLVKRIAPNAKVFGIDKFADLEQYL